MMSKIDKLIRKWSDPVLHRVCDAVEPGEGLDFLDTMERVCRKAPGVGLAAPQIGIAKRVIFTLCNDSRDCTKGRFMVNPVIVGHGDDTEVKQEGCLSYPGITKRIRRHTTISVRFEDLQRRQREQSFQGFEARVIQHEVDHLDGVCKVGDDAYPDDGEEVASAGDPGQSRPSRRPMPSAMLAASLIGLAYAGSRPR